MSDSGDDIGEEMVAWGRACRVVTRGHVSGRARTAVVGFVPEADGSLLVASGADADWARNLLADPECLVTIRDRTFRGRAERLGPEDHARAIRELILRYGTPSEALGHGPSFRIRSAEGASGGRTGR